MPAWRVANWGLSPTTTSWQAHTAASVSYHQPKCVQFFVAPRISRRVSSATSVFMQTRWKTAVHCCSACLCEGSLFLNVFEFPGRAHTLREPSTTTLQARFGGNHSEPWVSWTHCLLAGTHRLDMWTRSSRVIGGLPAAGRDANRPTKTHHAVDSLQKPSVKSGATHGRLARILQKDGTHKSRTHHAVEFAVVQPECERKSAMTESNHQPERDTSMRPLVRVVLVRFSLVYTLHSRRRRSFGLCDSGSTVLPKYSWTVLVLQC